MTKYSIGYRENQKLKKINAIKSFFSVSKEIVVKMFPPVQTKRPLNWQVKGV
jgi:hypothetical protein